MKVTVIIPHQNKRLEMLKEAIESIKAQTVQPIEIIEKICDGRPDRYINEAIKEMQGDAFVILSDDDKLDPTYIEKTIAAMIKENVDIVAPFLECFGPGAVGTESGMHGPDKFPFFSSLCKKSIWEKTGGWDESIGPMSDIDFWWQCFEQGAKWTKIGEPLIKYRKHGTQDSNTANWDDSRERLFKKHNTIRFP